MPRELLRASLAALLSGLVLAACGGVVENGRAPTEERLGTQESALCSGVSVTTLNLEGASSYQGEMAASGGWAVSTTSNGVRLEYYLDSALHSADERSGGSGTWYFSASGVACGTHTLLVKAYPLVLDSAGNRTTCYASVKSLTQSVTESCSPCPSGQFLCGTTCVPEGTSCVGGCPAPRIYCCGSCTETQRECDAMEHAVCRPPPESEWESM